MRLRCFGLIFLKNGELQVWIFEANGSCEGEIAESVNQRVALCRRALCATLERINREFPAGGSVLWPKMGSLLLDGRVEVV